MNNSILATKLITRDATISLEKVLENARADSGGRRDLNFLKYLIENNLISQFEAVMKRSAIDQSEEYYLERYKRMNYESDQHFMCRAIIQDEFKRIGLETICGMSVGNMKILRVSSNYDIITDDFSVLLDVGLTPARNFFRGLTDLRTKCFLLTSYFDDYIDDIIFRGFVRENETDFLSAVRDFEEGFKQYLPIQSMQDLPVPESLEY